MTFSIFKACECVCECVSAYCSFYKTNCIKQSIEIELIPNYVMSLELFKQKQINNTKKKRSNRQAINCWQTGKKKPYLLAKEIQEQYATDWDGMREHLVDN